MRAVAGLALVLTLTGCSALDGIRRPPPPPPSASSARAAFEVRTARVPVPADYQQSTVEFADARHGAALFTRCAVPKRRVGNHNDCSAILLVTADGGRSWQRREHPEPVADSQQLYVGFGGTLVLFAEPHAYYSSLDWGRTFKQSPYSAAPPVAYRMLGGPYEICCDGDPVPTVRHIVGDQTEPVAVSRPPVPGRPSTVAYRPGRDLWVASVDGGLAYTAFSQDEGRTWSERTAPGSDGGLGFVRLQASNDQSDLWLIGDRDRTSFPAVWRLGATGWQRLPTDGAPPEYRATAPAGGGALAVVGPAGTGLIASDGSYRATDWPPGDWVQALGDGTLLITDHLHGVLWLGPGGSAQRHWIELVLKNS